MTVYPIFFRFKFNFNLKFFCFFFILTFLFYQDIFSQEFPKKNIDLIYTWNDTSLPVNSSTVRYSDCLGFTFKSNEYALIGTTTGTQLFHLKENDVVNKGTLFAKFQSSNAFHRDFAVFKNYLYIVGDEGNNTLQIFDLSPLPEALPQLVKEDSLQFGRVHTIFIDTTFELLYSCIHRFNTGAAIAAPLKVFSLKDPLNLKEVYSGPAGVTEVHEVYARNGKTLLNCGFDGLRYYNFSTPSTPILLDQIDQYQEQGYNHQGWLSPNGSTYIFADETSGMRLKKCSVTENTLKVEKLFGTNFQNGSVPHNIMCTDTFAFVAYYDEGLRIYDLRNSTPIEIAYFDTYLSKSKSNMMGAWGVYSDLPSGKIIVSDRVNGLFVLSFDRKLFSSKNTTNLEIYPTLLHSGNNLRIQTHPSTLKIEYRIFTQNGQFIQSDNFIDQTKVEIPIRLQNGMYFIAIKTEEESGDTDELIGRFVVIND